MAAEIQNANNGPWSMGSHTTKIPTDCFGEIEFVGSQQRSNAKYVAVAQDTNMSVMLKLIMEHWNLEEPNLLISVTGGAKNFHMKPRLREVFRRGLGKAAQSTGAWIVDGGMRAGVMKHVGEAVRDYALSSNSQNRIINIGIAPFGCVGCRPSLTAPKGLWPAKYKLRGTKLNMTESYLDPNHTHFILVDNGTQYKFKVEIDFRAQLESAISQRKTNTGKDAVNIPTVCVVLEGGPGTLKTVHSAIKYDTPAVIVQGSGRAADILAYAYENSRETEIEVTDQKDRTQKRTISVIDPDIERYIHDKLEKEFGLADITSHMTLIRECLMSRELITVFVMDGKNSARDIDVAILKALLKANKDLDMVQLKLALAWNRIDVARSDIFVEDKRWEAHNLEDVMFTALKENRVDFVKLFLENGVHLQDFLTIERLLQLYNTIPKNTLLYTLIEKERRKNGTSETEYVGFKEIGDIIQELMGDFYKPLYHQDEILKKANVLNELNEENLGSVGNSDPFLVTADSAQGSPTQSQLLRPTTSTNQVKEESYKFHNPVKELFIWSIMMLRRDLAILLWEEEKESIAASLMAQKLLSSMKQQTENTYLQDKITSLAQYFSGTAVGILNECYLADHYRAQMLLVKALPNWGESTILQLAVQADNKYFISHSCCQTLLNTIWMGRMSTENSIFKIMFCCLVPPFLCLIKFRHEEKLKIHEARMYEKKQEFSDNETLRRASQNTLRSTTDPDGIELNAIVSDHTLSICSHDRPPKEGDQFFARGGEAAHLSFLQKTKEFFNAPLVIFIYNCVSYIAFLTLFSIILLTNFHPEISGPEVGLIIWVFTLFIEEIRQVASDDSSSFRLKVANYIFDPWNVIDVITLVLFLIGMILRFIPNADCFEAARLFLAIDLMLFTFRILDIFSVQKHLGPKLVMIGRMMIDLISFVVILAVFVMAYGLASQAILYPNAKLESQLIQDVLRKAYWQMYGELSLEEIEGSLDCSNNATLYTDGSFPRCVANTWIAPILLGFYIMITNILLFNLLIAMFSYTFNAVQENTDLHWKTQLYYLIQEYYKRPPLAPPIIFLSHIYLLVKFIRSKCCTGCCNYSAPTHTSFKMSFSEFEEKQLVLWESVVSDEYVRQQKNQEMQSVPNQVSQTKKQLEDITGTMEGAAESGITPIGLAKMPSDLEQRLDYMEKQLEVTFTALEWLVKIMAEKNGGSPPRLENLKQKKIDDEIDKKNRSAEEKKKMQKLFEDQIKLNVKSRSNPYPSSKMEVVRRYEVPDDKVPWTVEFGEYAPTNYTAPEVLEQPYWADPNLLNYSVDKRPSLTFNVYDTYYKVNRRSHIREYEVTEDKLPLNPIGRTGIVGRGRLGRWGPNHSADPVVTRWARNDRGELLLKDGKHILEFACIEREDSGDFAFPGGMLEPGQPVHKALVTEFTEEALGTLMDSSQKSSINAKLKQLFAKGTEVYKGYSDDERNTDNSWLETCAVNYHDEEGSLLEHFTLRAGKHQESASWQQARSTISLHASHLHILQKVAELHNASF